MSVVDIRHFGGILPAVQPRALPPENATTAQNLNPKTTDFRPLLDATAYAGVLSVANPKTIHRLSRTAAGAFNTDPSTGWKAYSQITQLVKWPQNDNNTERTSVTDGAGAYAPRVIDATGADRLLGVPAPDQPTVTLNEGTYFDEAARDAAISQARADIVAALITGLARAKVGATFTSNGTAGILEEGTEVANPPVLTRSRVHAYSAFEGAISDAYGSTVEADVAWVRTSGVGEWAQGTGTPSWYTNTTWHYQVPYHAYGAGYKYTAATAEAALTALTIDATAYALATVPFGSLDDDLWDSNSAVLHFDGANNSTTFTDDSVRPKAWTANGNAKISTAQSLFGGASGLFDGTGDYLTTPYSAEFDFPGDFCIDFDVYLTAYSASYAGSYGAAIIGTYSTSGAPANSGWQIRINGTASSYTTLNIYTGLTDLNVTGLTIPLNTHHRFRISRKGSAIKVYQNGALVGTLTNSDSFTRTTSHACWIGGLDDATYKFWLPGYLDELRVTKGESRRETVLLTAAQVTEISGKAADVFDPDGRYANPVVQALRDAVSNFETVINTRPPNSRTAAATATAKTAAIEAAANQIYDALQRNAPTAGAEVP